MNMHICGHAAADHPPSRNMVPTCPDFRLVSKKAGIKQCEHRLLPRQGFLVEKAEGELLMKPREPSLDNVTAVMVYKSLTGFGMLMKVGSGNIIMMNALIKSEARCVVVTCGQYSDR